MKLRHAVALALAAWHIMVFQSQGDMSVFGWLSPSYATKAECEKARRDYLRRFQMDLQHQWESSAQCVEENPEQTKTPAS